MKKLNFYTCALALLCSCTTADLDKKEYNQGMNLLPIPQQLEEGHGQFTLNAQTGFTISNDSLASVAQFYAQKMQASTGFDFKVESASNSTANRINLSINPNLAEKFSQNDRINEAYTLEVTPQNVNIQAATKCGLFYGMATLMQLLPAEIESTNHIANATWNIPSIDIQDSPRFGYRGLMIDVARHFTSVEGLKRHIDLLATFKINRLHLHLTDFQGWRIEIKKYPRLTEVGATRIDEYGKTYSGFYTQDEMREIVKYAADRYITIIPEIDVPGHTLAAIASYPNLSCTGEKYDVMSRWGPFPVVFCPGKEDMFEFVDNVFAELSQIFPSEYFHIGGDECPKEVWKTCRQCQARIRKEGLRADKEHTAEQRLQSYAIRRCEQILKKYGKKLIGWDEILQGGLAPDATVMSWRGEKGGIASAMMNHNVIMTPNSGAMYFDHYQQNAQAEPFAWGAFAPIVKTYAYNPVPEKLVELCKEKFILGVQGNAWSECMYNEQLVEYRVYPRILAVAETGWTPNEKKNFSDFTRRLNNAAVRMDYHGVNYHIPIPEQPDFCRNHVVFTGDQETVAFTTPLPMKMVYTLDGSEPTVNSTVYNEPITVDKNTTIKIRSILPSNKMGVTRTVEVEKQQYLEPVKNEPQHNGLKLRYAIERHLYLKELAEVKNWKDSVLTRIEPIVKLKSNKFRNVEYYVAVAEGYIYIPEKAIYEFSSNNSRITIGGKTAVDNDGHAQINSKYGKSIALNAGWHTLKVEQISNFIGGWNTQQRNNGSLQMRKYGVKEWQKITADDLKY